MKIELSPPDVSKSSFEFTVEEHKIRYALGAIKGIGEKAIDVLVAAREKEKRGFTSIYDLCSRVDSRVLNKGALETLIHAGALDSLPGHRAQKIAAIEDALRQGHAAQEDARSGQMSLFGAVAEPTEAAKIAAELPDVPPLPPGDLLAREKEALGFYLSGHPLDRFRHVIRQFSTHKISDLTSVPDNGQVVIGGIIRSIRTMLTKRGKFEGKRMAFARIEDMTSACEAVIFASVYLECAELVKEDSIVFFRGEVDRNRDEPSVKVNEVIPIDKAREVLTGRLTLRLDPGEDLEMRIVALKRILRQHPGSIPVAISVKTPRHGIVTVQAGQEFRVAPQRGLFDSLEVLLGSSAVKFN
jgi:DNA polymerase-3 subunit alpha